MAKSFLIGEAGKEISAKNQSRLRSILKSIQEFFTETGLDLEDDAIESKEAGGFAKDDLIKLLNDALKSKQTANTVDGAYTSPAYLADVYDDTLVYRDGWDGASYRCTYDVTEDGIVTLGTPTLVVRKVQYVEPGMQELSASESDYTIETPYIPLVESAVTHTGRTKIKLIKPGWGSSGYYGADVLRRDGPSMFRSGTHMYWDHQTQKEESERPEGSLRNLAAVLVEDAQYLEDAKDGPGLYADAEVRSAYRQDVNDLASHIGVSIRAEGRARIGEAEGRKGPIVTAITRAKSVDFVTRAGAGGRVLSLFESARNKQIDDITLTDATITDNGIIIEASSEEHTMTPEEIQKLVESQVDARVKPLQETIDRQRDALALRDARDHVTKHVESIKNLPKIAHDRVITATINEATRDANGNIDLVKLCESADQKATEEINYLSHGRVARTIGTSKPLSESESSDSNKAGEDMTAILTSWGMSADAAKIAAKGRS